MFKKLTTTTMAVVTAATLLGSGPAAAFQTQGVPLNTAPNGTTLGDCGVIMGQYTAGSIDVRVETPAGFYSARPIPSWGGSVMEPAGTFGSTELTISNIQGCGILDATNFVSVGASGTFASDDYYGFSVEGTDPVSGEYSRWEFAFTGATTTTLVSQRTQATPPDTTPPTVTLTSTTTTLTGTDPFSVTATFDEDVTGFEELDVTVTNGGVVAGSLSGGAAVYTFLVEPTGNGDVTIFVPENVAEDLAGNPNTASDVLVIGNRIVEITQEQIAGFMLGRANNLASNQPRLIRFLMGEGCGSFSANANEAAGSINGCVSQGNAWAEISGAWSGDGSYTLGTLGVHEFLNPNLLIGGMVQFDYTDDPANNASGHGWMVGPYFVAQVPDQPLFFEGRLLYGQTDNDITPLGTYTDSFETERWLAQLRATGEYQVQNTTLMPLLDFTYTDDTQQAYTDSLGNTISGQTISLMQLSTGLDFSQPLPVQTGALMLTGGVSGIYSSTDGGAAAPEFENWRGRTHLGLNYDTGTGATMNVGAFYDGLGTNYESYGVSAGFDWRF